MEGRRTPPENTPTQPSAFHGRAGGTPVRARFREALGHRSAPRTRERTCATSLAGRTTAVCPNVPTVTSPSPAPEPRPASRTGPTGPILRANPYPEVTDLICRLPLPTLVYRPEAAYLGDQMRLWVRTGPKSRRRRKRVPTMLPGITTLAFFTDRRWHSGRRKNRGALRLTVLPTPSL